MKPYDKQLVLENGKQFFQALTARNRAYRAAHKE